MRARSLTYMALQGLPDVRPGDDLPTLILEALRDEGSPAVEQGDIFVVSSKVISKAEDRFVNLASVQVSPEARTLAQQTGRDPRILQLVLEESNAVLRATPAAVIVEHRLGFVCANAGIDHSNVRPGENWVLLLPADPSASAARLRQELERALGLRLGVMVIDSHGRAWRLGTVGITIGLSGLPGLVDLRGRPDLYGYHLQITEVGAADELAAGASLLMGQANEATPVVIARGFPYDLREGSLSELLRPREQDLFR